MKTKILLFQLALLPFLMTAQPNRWINKTDYNNQRNGKFVTDSTYFYDWNILELNWLNVERFNVTQRDQFGNQTKSMNSLWDETTTTWVDSRQQELAYYDSINLHYLRAFTWDSKAEEWKLSDSIYHNTSNKPIISWFKIWDPFKFRFTFGRRVYYQYSIENMLNREDISIFDTISGNWLDNEIINYDYFENGLMHQKTIKKWKENRTWIDSLRFTYSYNELNQNTMTNVESWNENGFWENATRTDWYYNTSGSQDAIYKFNWNSLTQEWDSTSISKHSYDQQERLLEVLQVQWDTFYNGWINLSKTTNFYNEQGQRSSRLLQYWDAFGFYWYNVSNNSYTYDDNGNQLDFIFQFWDEDGEVWLNIYRDENWWSYFEPASVPETNMIEVAIYPNPTSDFIRIHINEPFSTGHLTLFTSNGIPLISRPVFSNSTKIDVSHLTKGSYFLKLDFDGKEEIRKVLVF